jgi:phosphotransferase system enzyme I (PtsI)
VQYIFAASREDGYLEEYRQCTHPAIIRLIRKIIITSTCSGKEVSICGEMASDPRMAALLVGAGASAFSCSLLQSRQ